MLLQNLQYDLLVTLLIVDKIFLTCEGVIRFCGSFEGFSFFAISTTSSNNAVAKSSKKSLMAANAVLLN
jgi:hypothetical protein